MEETDRHGPALVNNMPVGVEAPEANLKHHRVNQETVGKVAEEMDQ